MNIIEPIHLPMRVSAQPRRRRYVVGAAIGISATLASLVSIARADDLADDRTIVATVNVPAQGLSCDDAAAQASVTFKTLQIPFDVKRVSVFVDGHGLPEASVDQAWPSVAVRKGLHPGRNLVEFIVYGPDNQSMDRKQTVLIGTPSIDSDVAPAQIECVGEVAAADIAPSVAPATEQYASTVEQAESPQEQALQEQPQEAPPPQEVERDTTYIEEPVYSYYPAPVFYGPVYPVGYFAPPLVIYAPAVPLFFYNRWGPRYYGGGYYRGGYYGRPGYYHDHDGDHWHNGGRDGHHDGDWHGGGHDHDGGGHNNGNNGGGNNSGGPFHRPDGNDAPRNGNGRNDGGQPQRGNFDTATPPTRNDSGERFGRPAARFDGGNREQYGHPAPQAGFGPRTTRQPGQRFSPPQRFEAQRQQQAQRFNAPPRQAQGPRGGNRSQRER